jgi:DNA-binding CsgD family transcriptional regulator
MEDRTSTPIANVSSPGTREYASFLLAARGDLARRVSPAQRAVLELLLTGVSESDIATTLGRSKHTIHDHTKSIYQALQVNSRVELVLLFTHIGGGAATARSAVPDESPSAPLGAASATLPGGVSTIEGRPTTPTTPTKPTATNGEVLRATPIPFRGSPLGA